MLASWSWHSPSTTVRNKLLLFISYPFYGICYSSLDGLRQSAWVLLRCLFIQSGSTIRGSARPTLSRHSWNTKINGRAQAQVKCGRVGAPGGGGEERAVCTSLTFLVFSPFHLPSTPNISSHFITLQETSKWQCFSTTLYILLLT